MKINPIHEYLQRNGYFKIKENVFQVPDIEIIRATKQVMRRQEPTAGQTIWEYAHKKAAEKMRTCLECGIHYVGGKQCIACGSKNTEEAK